MEDVVTKYSESYDNAEQDRLQLMRAYVKEVAAQNQVAIADSLKEEGSTSKGGNERLGVSTMEDN